MLPLTPRFATKASALLIILAGTAVYWNTLGVPFFFDDIASIVENPSIKDLLAAKEVLAPPTLNGAGIAGRPMVNLSLAINHALGGDSVWGYHAFNLLIHLLSGLALFGIVRRTIKAPGSATPATGKHPGVAAPDTGKAPGSARSTGSGSPTTPATDKTPGSATPATGRPPDTGAIPAAGKAPGSTTPATGGNLGVALMAALFWTLHPLQTETVTCVIQRTEGLMGLFYLTCFYAFIRALEPGPGQRLWQIACWGACALGMATKEVMVSAPVLLFLYDRTFAAGSFAGAWRARRWQYLCLATTWALLILVMQLSAGRGGTVGFGGGVTPWEYALTSCKAVILYLRLSVWPAGLVLDYGTQLVRNPLDVLPQGLLLIALVAGTLYSLWKRPVLGFVGMWFFCILAPSSSVVPLVTQTMAEHRMYLPLASVTVLAAWALFQLKPRAALTLSLAIALALGVATHVRNKDYANIEGLWKDTLEKCPDNFRALFNLVGIYEKEQRVDEAIIAYRQSLRGKPEHVTSHYQLAFHLAARGYLKEALPHFSEAARLEPKTPDSHTGMGTTLMQLGRLPEAKACFEKAVKLRPGFAALQYNLGLGHYMLGEFDEAAVRFAKATELKPDFTEAYNRLGNAHAQAGRFRLAASAFREALKLAPKRTELQVNLGTALLYAGKPAEALPYLEAAAQADPSNVRTQELLAEAKQRAN